MSSTRLVGVDAARGLAILGMFVAHLASGFPGSWLADGRPSALFAMLAGTGLGFMTARALAESRAAADRQAMGVQVGRIVRRAGALYLLGVALMLLGTPVVVILGSYAVMFALMIPFLACRPAVLLGWAAAIMVIAPPGIVGLRLWINGEPDAAYGPPVLFELATGYYPALSWIAYLLVGLAVVRLDLRRLRTAWLLLAAGAAAAAAGYGVGLWAEAALGPDAPPYLIALVSAAPHTDSGPELLGNAGFAVMVVALAVLAARTRIGRVVLHPVAATGRLSLTVYSAHIVYIAILGPDAVWYPESQAPLLGLVAVTLVASTAWVALLGQGPLERLLGRVTNLGVGATTVPRAL